jgi:ABC-2 type transport system ATP-binding protein
MKLEADQLHVTRSGKEVLKGISFSVASGEVFALLGGNGAGKSTTLLTFLGFIEPIGGSMKIDGIDVREDLTSARRSIAYLPEAATLYEHLNAYENLSYFLDLAGTQFEASDLEDALEKVSLANEARKQPLKSYSKGMRQKVAIALAMLRDTQILLLDEPTSGLDPVAIDEFHKLVRSLADEGKIVLMVTHDVYGACQVADRVGLLRHGKLVGEFTAEAGQNIDTEAVHRAFAMRETT